MRPRNKQWCGLDSGEMFLGDVGTVMLTSTGIREQLRVRGQGQSLRREHCRVMMSDVQTSATEGGVSLHWETRQINTAR